MDGTGAIEMNREALKRIVAALVAMAGLGQSATDCLSPTADRRPTLLRHLHRAILRLLRPAESAVRRLAVALACSLPPLPGLRPRKPGPPKVRKPGAIFVREGVGTGIVLRSGAPVPAGLAHLVPAKAAPRPLSFPLLDPLPRWRIRRRWRPASGVPSIGMAGDRSAIHAWRPPLSDDPLDAGRLGRRLTALARALDDLPGLARRFVRWQARRDRALAAGRTHRITALRGGRPPGGRLSRYDPDASRRANIREIDEILAHAHALARFALTPDTS